jgi:hypothetical protein
MSRLRAGQGDGIAPGLFARGKRGAAGAAATVSFPFEHIARPGLRAGQGCSLFSGKKRARAADTDSGLLAA